MKIIGAIIAAGIALSLSSACSRTMLDDLDDDDGGNPTNPAEGGVPGCGDGTCAATESCSSCAVDCGVCMGCGNGVCDAGESCTSCPHDCGVCATCGDGFCKGDETCLSCAPDCGACKTCGDGTCDPKTEDCFSCPGDCGKCEGCGDGLCRPPETCASCTGDCGVCAVCGNGKCEGPYESCTNCHEDCGDCQTIGCMAMLTCALGCIDGSTRPPNVSVSCVADCVSRGCASAQYLFDQAFNCFLGKLNDCGTNIGCLTSACDSQVAACIGANCSN